MTPRPRSDPRSALEPRRFRRRSPVHAAPGHVDDGIDPYRLARGFPSSGKTPRGGVAITIVTVWTVFVASETRTVIGAPPHSLA